MDAKIRRWLIAIIYTIQTLPCGEGGLVNSTLMQTPWQFRNQLFDALVDSSRYDRRSRPLAPSNDYRDPVHIDVSLYLAVLGDLDTQSMEMDILVDLQFQWTDLRLRYRDTYPAVETLVTEDWGRDKVWLPTFVVGNEKQSIRILVPKENVMMTITADGLVSYQNRIMMRVYCYMNVRKFPFDEQFCPIHLESWSLPVSDLVLDWSPAGVQVNPEFRLMEFILRRVTLSTSLTRPSFSGNISRLYAHLNFQRESLHYFVDFYFPAIMLVLLSWISFWLDPSQIAARVTLGSGSVLSFITVARNLTSIVPRVGYCNAIDYYSMMCFVFIFLALMELAMVNSLWRRKRDLTVNKLNTSCLVKSTLLSRTGVNKRAVKNSGPTLMDVKAAGLTLDNHRDPNGGHKFEGLSTSSSGASTRSSPTVSGQSITSVTSDGRADSYEGKIDGKHLTSPQEMAKWLDRRARLVFPTAFAIANALYWAFVWL